MAQTIFAPKLICLQIVALQCLFYLLQGGILEGFQLCFGTDVSLTQIFTARGLETESAEGLLNMVAVVLSFISGSILLYLIVGKSKKCLDFSITLLTCHLFACWYYETFPATLLWWLIHVSGVVIMVMLGEHLCSRRELKDIPLFIAHAPDG